MLKKFRLSFTLLGVLLAAFMLLPQMTMAAAQQSSHYKPMGASFAFVGLINNGIGSGTALNGNLSIQINPYGSFNGTFTEPNGMKVAAHGAVNSFGQLDVTIFLDSKHGVILQAQGTVNSSYVYVGNFQEYAGYTELATGIWSGAPIADPLHSTIYAFVGQVTNGPDSGTTFNADIVVNNYSGAASVNLVDGTLVPATFLRYGSQAVLVISLGSGKQIVGFGTTGGNRLIGTFVGPVAGDTGFWSAEKIG